MGLGAGTGGSHDRRRGTLRRRHAGLTPGHPVFNIDGFAATAVDGRHAWVLSGPPVPPGKYVLYRTADGGRTWSTSRIPAQQAGYMTFIDPRHGWMQAARPTSNHRANAITLSRTTDGGRTWTVVHRLQVPLPIEPNVQKGGCQWSRVRFSSPTHGIVGLTCDRSSMLGVELTDDGGKTWRRVTLPPFPHRKGRILSSMVDRPILSGRDGATFADLCIGSSVSCYDYGALYRTSNGGRTWRPTSTTIRGSSPLFAGTTHVWLPPYSCLRSCPQKSSLLRTRDGGLRWIALPLPRLLAPDMHGDQQFQFITPSIGFAVATNEFDPSTHFFRTNDGGRTWHAFYPRISWSRL